MINTQLGSDHYFTNKSNQDTIHIRPGPGEKIILHGTLDPPPLTEATFPIEGSVEVTGYYIDDVEEIIPNDGNPWLLTGQIVKFNKANFTHAPSRYKFITSSAQRNSTAWTFEGGFRVFDRDNEQALSFPASEYSWTPTSGCTISTLRNCDIHGYESRIFIPMNFNAYYIQYPGIPPETMDTFIAYNNPINVDTIVTEHQAGYGLGQPTQGVSVFHWIMVTWGQSNNYFGGGGISTAKVYRRGTLNQVHLPSQGSAPFIYLSDLGFTFNKFAVNAVPSNKVFACGASSNGHFVMYILNSSNFSTGVDATSNVVGSATSHVACSMDGVDTKGYFVNADNNGRIRIFIEDFSLQHTLQLGTTIWGIAIEENKLVVLSTRGLTLFTIHPTSVVEHFTKPFDSTWISNYEQIPQPVNGPVWTDIPIDIFKNEILVGSSVVNKVFLLKLSNIGSYFENQSIYLHNDASNSGITIDTNNLRIDTDRSTDIIVPSAGSTTALTFNNPSGTAGSIVTNNLTTSYLTASDYRIKYDITSMTDGLSKISNLNPVYFKFKCKDCRDTQCPLEDCECCSTHSNEEHEGFIAHELQAIIPSAVSGYKDQLDSRLRPVYQSIDTSFIVASLVSAIKSLSSKVTALNNRIEELEDQYLEIIE